MTFARDLLLADYFEVPEEQRSVWLQARAKSRRDLLWFARYPLRLDRLSTVIHRPAANFCMSIFRSKRYGFGNYRDPRGNGKTSLSTRAGALWNVIQDPIECIERGWPGLGRESRFGINTLKAEMTAAFMQMLLDDLEAPDLRTLFPEIYPEVPKRWGQKGIELRRGPLPGLESHPLFAAYPPMTRFLDTTFAPGSLESGRAGAHTHGEFVDDPVNEKTWDSETNIASAVHGIRQLFNIIRPERGFRLITGNDWCPGDVNDVLDQEGAWQVFQRSATACDMCKDGYPTDENGLVPKDAAGRPQHKHQGKTFTWLMPESDGSMPDLARIKSQLGAMHIYLAQYENDPVAEGATLWTRDRLPIFEVIQYGTPGIVDPAALIKIPDTRPFDRASLGEPKEQRYEICRVRDLDITVAFDPSSGGQGLSASEASITVLGRTPFDTFCWLSTKAKQDDPLSMLGELVEEVIKWHARRVVIDAVAYQVTIASLLERELRARKVGWLDFDEDIIPFRASKSDGDKETRIRDGLNPLINTRSLLVNPNTLGYHAAMLQMEGFPIRRPWDTLDSLIMHAHAWGRIPLTQAKRKEMRLKELLRAKERRQGMGVAYGWGNAKRP